MIKHYGDILCYDKKPLDLAITENDRGTIVQNSKELQKSYAVLV